MMDASKTKRHYSNVMLVAGKTVVVGRGKYDAEELRLNVKAGMVSRRHLEFGLSDTGGLYLVNLSRADQPSLIWLQRGCDDGKFELLPRKSGSLSAKDCRQDIQSSDVVQIKGCSQGGLFQYDLTFRSIAAPAAPDPIPPAATAPASTRNSKRRRTDSFARAGAEMQALQSIMGDETTADLDPEAFQMKLDRGAEYEDCPGRREIEVRRAGEPAYWKLVVTLNIDTKGAASHRKRGPPAHYTILYLRAPNNCATGYPGVECTRSQPRLIPEGLCNQIEAVCAKMFGDVGGIKQDLHDTVTGGTYASDAGLIVSWRREVARICDEYRDATGRGGFTFESTACQGLHDVHCTAGEELGRDENDRVGFKGETFSKMYAPIASNLSLWWHIMYKLGDGGKADRDNQDMLTMHRLANLIAKLDTPARLQSTKARTLRGAVKLDGVGDKLATWINRALGELLAAADAGPTKTPPQDYYTPAMSDANPWASQEDRQGLTPSQDAACAADPWASMHTFPVLLGLGQFMPWGKVAVLSLTADAKRAVQPLLDMLGGMRGALELGRSCLQGVEQLHMSLYRARRGTDAEKNAAAEGFVTEFKRAVGTVSMPHGAVRPTQIILKRMGAAYSDCVVMADCGRRGDGETGTPNERGTMRPLCPPRNELNVGSQDQDSRAAYVLLLMVEEVPGGEAAAFVTACRLACNEGVRTTCFQQDGTRHITLAKGITSTTAAALRKHGLGGQL